MDQIPRPELTMDLTAAQERGRAVYDIACEACHGGAMTLQVVNRTIHDLAFVIDDARRKNAFGLLMSLNMLIEFGAEGGFDYTGAQYDGWCRAAGFERTEIQPLTGPTSAAIACK